MKRNILYAALGAIGLVATAAGVKVVYDRKKNTDKPKKFKQPKWIRVA